MIETNQPTKNETDNNLPVSKYLRSYLRKIVNEKFLKTLLFIFMLMFFNVGAKYPAMSENIGRSAIDIYNEKIANESVENAKEDAERYMKMYQEIYEKSLIQQIEFESEVVIPEYFDFKYVEYTYKLSSEVGIDNRILFRLIFQESRFKENATSEVGAKGLMQLMPDTRREYYKKFRVDTLDLDRNQEDIYIGARYLLDLQEMWHTRGNSDKVLLKLSLAAYNAGPAKVILYKGIPPYKQTIDFVTFILKPHSNPVFYSNILQKSGKKNIS
jgi:soluble lytic murein transglycosylase-like protein